MKLKMLNKLYQNSPSKRVSKDFDLYEKIKWSFDWSEKEMIENVKSLFEVCFENTIAWIKGIEEIIEEKQNFFLNPESTFLKIDQRNEMEELRRREKGLIEILNEYQKRIKFLENKK